MGDNPLSWMQEEAERLKAELCRMRENMAALELAERAAQAAKEQAEEDASNAKKAREEISAQTSKAGQIWQTMIDARQERDKAVADLSERIASLTVQRDAKEVRVKALQREVDELRAELNTVQRRVRAPKGNAHALFF
jgi:chromosome segregation ATPase